MTTVPRILLIGLLWAAAGCQTTRADTEAELVQAVAELRAEVSALKRTVARLEKELAEAKAVPTTTPTAAGQPAATVAKVQCAGTTTSGARCKRSAREGSRFCWQHAGQ